MATAKSRDEQNRKACAELEIAETFTQRWQRKERECGFDVIASDIISCAGHALPRAAAPCLTFHLAMSPQPVWSVYGSPSEWDSLERGRLAPFEVIGSDGAGNPICIEQDSGAIWLLDHEDRFQSKMFVNSSVPQLTECLLAYMGEKDRERFEAAIAQIDIPALAQRSFWWHEAAGLNGDS